ncbi:hypothetical protein TIFTF001_018930 [Ficus carica]|uniref:Uncharacterized protein n=1 Tax=Ficus carica TaxID=3494 RepID=A0AA88D8F1_FICCA|nr:hypothetical protein TIFTF001_018930 [Ficus carica]
MEFYSEGHLVVVTIAPIRSLVMEISFVQGHAQPYLQGCADEIHGSAQEIKQIRDKVGQIHNPATKSIRYALRSKTNSTTVGYCWWPVFSVEWWTTFGITVEYR